MNDEVSVAELLVREGWGDRPEPGQSRWRVVAVMLAVVIGCGAAAVLVALNSGKTRQDASPVDQIQVIPFPQRTTGLGGADQATDSPPEGGTGGGDVIPGVGVPRETVTEVPGRTPATESSSTDTATPTTTPTSGVPGSSVTPTSTTTPPRGHTPTPTPTPTKRPTCVLVICW
ncbi:hypothetical protein [Amycolatopsis sp. cmx-4-68]|uniref:hypothetical protein n=1 Tax=Amycolatopsis sp. cmx-4-68 TaxID=2790938 RepID=UPI00397A0616